MRKRHFSKSENFEDSFVKPSVILEEHRKNEFTTISALTAVYRCIENQGCLSDELVGQMGPELDFLSEKFGLDSKCVLLLAVILEESGAFNSCSVDDICAFMGYTNMEFLSMRPCLDRLLQLRMIRGAGRTVNGFAVTEKLLSAIEKDEKFIHYKTDGLTVEEFFLNMREDFLDLLNDNIKADVFLSNTWHVISRNLHLAFCEKCQALLFDKFPDMELIIFFYLCQRYANFSEDTVGIDRCERFCRDRSNVPVLRALQLNRTDIQQEGYIEFPCTNGFKDTSMLTLSEKVKESFLAGVEFVKQEPEVYSGLMPFADIREKELFYNSREDELIGRLHGLLDQQMFSQVQQRLDEKGMRKGFNCIFYGAPGTGKTASVYELARRSGRDVLSIEVSKIKSKWVGESERQMKAVFDLYKRLCKNRERVPILLFNEADAIFGKRIDEPGSSADKMNNAIQNILLQGMEDIEGILIATTNLEASLDPAFERRFIYKVRFDMPSQESRSKMWRYMIPELGQEECSQLAGEFTFSGGQIENIARKSAVDYVLSGENVNLEKVRKFCTEEMLHAKSNRNRIGFGNL